MTQNMDVYGSVSQGSSGRACLRAAAINNRAAIMAERIDFLDSNWSQYYAVEKEGNATVFNSTKLISRTKFQRRYKKIIKGLDEALELSLIHILSGWGLGYNVYKKEWSKEQLDILGIDISYMPKIVKPWDRCV